MSSKVIVKDFGWNKIKKEFDNMGNAFTAIGLFEEDVYQDGKPIALIGLYNEFGTDTIPARPFIRNWFDGNIRKTHKKVQDVIGKVLDKQISAQEALEELGEYGEEGIRKSIIDFRSPPNAPATIAIKGFNDPLIFTGQMRDDIKHKEFINEAIPK